MTPRPVSPVLGIVIPIHNEASHLERSLGTILEHVEGIGETYELIAIDDGSTDGTWPLLQHLAARNPRVRAVRLSRQFGKEAAICAGLAESNARATVVMDSDLQHPPALIPDMHRFWKNEGFDIVEAVKVERGRESRRAALGARLFYRVFGRLSGMGLADSTDFKLLDRQVVDAWSRLPERNVFFRGMSAWTGFRRRQVPLSVPARSAGESQWSSVRLLILAVDSITSFSSLPLYFITVMGAAFLVFAAALSLLALYFRATGQSLAGFPTVIIIELLIGSTVLIGLGIVGQYIAKIYEEVKARPRFIVAETTGEPRRGAHAGTESASAVPREPVPEDRAILS